MEKTVTTPLTKGLIISIILIVLGLVLHFLDLSQNQSVQYLNYVILIAGVIWSVNSYGKQINYNSTFGNYFAHGFKVSAIVTVVMIIFTIIFALIFPEMKEKGIEAAREGMVKKGLTEEQISQAISFTEKFFYVFIIAGILIMFLIIGAISSVIGAAVTKKEPVPGEGFN